MEGLGFKLAIVGFIWFDQRNSRDKRIKMWNVKIQTYRPIEQNSSWRMGTCLAICGPMACSIPGFPVLHYLRVYSNSFIESVTPSNHLILCHLLLLLPSIFPSIRVFPKELALCIRWPKYWSFSFSISPSHDYSGMTSFSIDCFNILAVQRTLKSLIQHHSWKASVFQCKAFFMVQVLHLYMITGKTLTLAMWTFVGKVISLLFNMLSRLAIVFLSRRKHLLISWQHLRWFWSPRKYSLSLFSFFPHLFAFKWWDKRLWS